MANEDFTTSNDQKIQITKQYFISILLSDQLKSQIKSRTGWKAGKWNFFA
jgi:hypothetical protein